MGRWQQRAGTATVPVTATVALLDRPLPNAQELAGSGTGTGAGNQKLDWAELDGTGQDRTSHSTRQV